MTDAALPVLRPLPPEVKAGRIPAWHLERLLHRACPVCGDDRPLPLCERPDGLRVGRCPACAMIYLPEIPDARDLAEFYQGYAAYKGLTARKLSWFRTRLLGGTDPHIRILQNTGGLKNQSLGEIGCSFGQFLQLARGQGARVTGVEVDEPALAYLKQLGLPAGPSLNRGESFDIICAFQLLEHLAEPGPAIEQIASALKQDGRLLLALPNGGEAVKVGPWWTGFRVDLEHLNYFAVDTLSRLLGRHGLDLEQFWEYSQPGVQRPTLNGIPGNRLSLRLREKVTRLVAGQSNHPFYSDGTFVLTALARKCTRGAG